MLLDAIVLAGGRSARLGGVDKMAMSHRGSTLLDHALSAVAAARTVVVVGPWRPTVPRGTHSLVFTREGPEFGGPVAGVAAGLAALRSSQRVAPDATLVVAGDLARPEEAVAELLEGVRRYESCEVLDGFVGTEDDRRPQYLIGYYRTEPLARALADLPRGGAGVAMRALAEGLRLGQVALSSGLAEDVDTWEDAARLGVTGPAGTDAQDERQPG